VTQARAGALIAIAMATAAAASCYRAISSGRIALGPEGVGTGGPALVVGAALAVAGLAYAIALRAPAAKLSARHLVVAVAIHLCAAAALPFSSSDIFANLALGRLANLELNPYVTPPRALPPTDPYRRGLDWPDAPSAWGPLVTYTSALAARRSSLLEAVFLFKALMAGAVLAAVAAAFAYGRTLLDHEGAQAFVFFAFNPLLAWELTGQAHNDALLVLAVTLFVWLSTARRSGLAVPSLWLGLLAKYAVAPTLALYLLKLRRESWRRASAAALSTLAVIALAWAPFYEGLASLRGLWIVLTPTPVRVVNSLASFARLVGNALDVAWLFTLWSAAGLVVMLALGLLFAARVRTIEDVLRDSLRFILLYQILAMPSFWPWYATWLLPLAMAHPNARLRPAIAVFSALAPSLYLTGAAGALAILVVDGLTLWLFLKPVSHPRVSLDGPA